jgi:hypothetical protein
MNWRAWEWRVYWIRDGWEWGWLRSWNVLRLGKVRVWM